MTAHELRTPVGVLGGSADILSQHLDELSDEERTELIDAMVSSTGRLRRLVDDLLTAARLEANALDMRVESVRVRDVLDQAIAVASRAHPAAEIIADVPAELRVSRRPGPAGPGPGEPAGQRGATRRPTRPRGGEGYRRRRGGDPGP